MCTTCELDICLVLDALIIAYLQSIEQERARSGQRVRRRPKYLSLELKPSDGAVSPEYGTLAELIKRAPGIGFQPWEFKTELAKRSGFGEAIELWANQGKIPNGIARKIILTCAEEIIRSRGANPTQTLSEAA